MKNREKILLLIIALQAVAIAGLIFCNKPVAPVVAASLPSSDYAFLIYDLDEEEKADFCANY
jgi:hypothetical protein